MMAGSYNHITTHFGRLVSNESFERMIENLGDAYETVEELFGMIWYLAATLENVADLDAPAAAYVEGARLHYKEGLEISREKARSK